MTPEEKDIVRQRLRRLREKNGVRTIDGVEPAVSYETAYYREIVKPIEEVSAMVEEDLLPFLESSGYFQNAPTAEIVRAELKRFEKYADSFGGYATRVASKMVNRNDEYHRREFVREIDSKFGINITEHMSEDRVRATLVRATKDNVNLIVNLPKEYYNQINRVVFEGLTSGNDFGSIRKQLESLDGINRRRAKLIAVDQTGKLIGGLNQVRQENEGIVRYQWSASLDARTRKRHVENDGEVFDWSDKTPGKAYGPPGEEVRCRCVARGVLDEATLRRRTPAEKSSIIGRRTALDELPAVPPARPRPRTRLPGEPAREVQKLDLPAVLEREEKKIVSQKYETSIAFDDDGTEIFRKDGNSGSVDFTNEEILRMRGKTVTHNHPNDSPFSAKDLRFFAFNRLKEIRAVGKDYTYTISGSVNSARFPEFTKAVSAAQGANTRAIREWYRLQKQKGVLPDDIAINKMEWEIIHEGTVGLARRFGLSYRRVKTYG